MTDLDQVLYYIITHYQRNALDSLLRTSLK